MKKVLLALMVPGAFFIVIKTNARNSPGIIAAIGSYHEYQYDYFPEIDVYYDITNHRYIYFENNRWVYASELPAMYRSYDLTRGYKVSINEYKPYLHAGEYREKYRNYYDNYNHRSQNANDNRIDERNMQRNNPPDNIKNSQQNDRIRAESNRPIERNELSNGNNNLPKDAGRIQPNNNDHQNKIRSENIPDDKHVGTINNNSNNSPINPTLKEPIIVPQANSGTIQKNELTEDEQRARFYHNGQTGGVREAVRSPKFNQPKELPDTTHGILPKTNAVPNNIGKDSLHNGGQIKKTSGQGSNAAKDSLRNDHIVMTDMERRKRPGFL